MARRNECHKCTSLLRYRNTHGSRSFWLYATPIGVTTAPAASTSMASIKRRCRGSASALAGYGTSGRRACLFNQRDSGLTIRSNSGISTGSRTNDTQTTVITTTTTTTTIIIVTQTETRECDIQSPYFLVYVSCPRGYLHGGLSGRNLGMPYEEFHSASARCNP